MLSKENLHLTWPVRAVGVCDAVGVSLVQSFSNLQCGCHCLEGRRKALAVITTCE